MNRKSHTYNYTYLTTNLINGKQYFGVHSSDIKPEEDPYLGSGNLLIKAIKKYGKHNFKREICAYFDNYEAAFLMEKEVVNEEWIRSPDTYNIALGGYGGYISDEAQIKKSKSMTGKKRQTNYTATKSHRDNLSKALSGQGNGMYGKKHSTESKDKMSASASLRTGKYNSMYGKKHSAESKNKMSQSRKGKPFKIFI